MGSGQQVQTCRMGSLCRRVGREQSTLTAKAFSFLYLKKIWYDRVLVPVLTWVTTFWARDCEEVTFRSIHSRAEQTSLLATTAAIPSTGWWTNKLDQPDPPQQQTRTLRAEAERWGGLWLLRPMRYGKQTLLGEEGEYRQSRVLSRCEHSSFPYLSPLSHWGSLQRGIIYPTKPVSGGPCVADLE